MPTVPGDILHNMLAVMYSGQGRKTMCGPGKGDHLELGSFTCCDRFIRLKHSTMVAPAKLFSLT